MQKHRLVPLAILSLSIGLMTACDSTSSNGKAPTVSSPVYISGVQTGPTDVSNTLDNVTVYHLTGTVTDVKSWVWTVLSGSTVVETLVEPSPGGSGDTKLGNTYTLVTFTPKATWGPTGTYTLRGVLTGTDGSTQTTVNITFKAAPGGTTGTTLTSQGTLSVGGFSTSAKSFIGLNPVAAYSGTQSATSYASIDLVVTANASGSASVFESTAAGVSNGDLTSSYWGSGRATLIQSVTNTPATQQDAAAALTGSTQSVTITPGGIYVAKTVDGTYAVLSASSVSGVGDLVTLTVTILE